MNEKTIQMLAKPLSACTHLSSTVSQLFEPQVQKITVFKYRSAHFCFPWRRPCDYHAICSMDGKTIRCLPNPSQHVPIYIQLFLSYMMLRSMRVQKSLFFTTFLFTTFLFFFVIVGAITLNVVWMEREFDAYKLSHCMCPSNYNHF